MKIFSHCLHMKMIMMISHLIHLTMMAMAMKSMIIFRKTKLQVKMTMESTKMSMCQ